MTYLDIVKAFVLTLKKIKLVDKTKAEQIKQFILNLDGIADATKKGLLVAIKPFILENNILKDNTFINIVNSTELYDKVMKQTDANRENADVDVDINTVEKILNIKYDKELNRDTGDFQINKYSLFAYLLFTSGLRTNEVTNNSFSIVDYNTITAERISKKDNNDTENIINLLIPASEWLELFNKLQNQIKGYKLYSASTIAAGIKRKLLPIHPDLHAHSLRKLYLAYHLQVKKTGADKIPSINTKNLLNHTNENTSVFYTGTVRIMGELNDIIDNTDYSKLKVIDLKKLLVSKNIWYSPKMRKPELL